MIIDINEINIKKEIMIDNDFNFIDNLEKARIKNIKNMHFIGKLYYNLADEIKLEGNLNGILILEDANDLSDFEYKINLKIDEILENNQNTLDISLILWENIVLEVPMRVAKEDLKEIKGNGWEVLKEEKKEEIDPRLEKLLDLYKGGE